MNYNSTVPIPEKPTREPMYLRSVSLALAGREHLPPLGGVLRQRRHRRTAPECSLRPAGRQHPRRLAAAHCRPREPPRLRHVSEEPGSLRHPESPSQLSTQRQQPHWFHCHTLLTWLAYKAVHTPGHSLWSLNCLATRGSNSNSTSELLFKSKL